MATLKYKTKDGEYKPLAIMSPSSKIERFEKDEDGNIVLEQGGNVFTVENSDVYFSDLLDEDAIMTIISGGAYQIEDTSKVEEFIANAKGKIVVFDGIVIPYIFLFEDSFDFSYCGVNTYNDELGIWHIQYLNGEFTLYNSAVFSDYQKKLVSGTNIKTINGESILGEGNLNITAASLGIDTALKYHGVTTTSLTDGATTNPIVINGSNHNAASGCVVFYGNKEFVFDGTTWKELGDGSNHKIKQDAVNSPSASGTTTAFIDTISQDANGKITATKKNITSASTSTAGIVQLSSSTSSTSTTTAATASAVKSAYDRASAAITNAATAATTAAWDGVSGKPTIFTANGETGAKNLNDIRTNGSYYVSPAATNRPGEYGELLCMSNVDTHAQIYVPYASGSMLFRGANNASGYYDWRTVIDSQTIGSQSVNYANSAGAVAWTNVTGKPTIPTNTNQLTNGAGFITSYTDTKNTAGSTNSTSKLYLIGAGSQAANAVTYSNSSCYMQSGYLYATSDERLKNFENDIPVDFNMLKSIPKKYFRWKENPENLNIGTSAQALQKVYPELVTTDENGEMGVNYQHLSVIALAAIDKLHEENLELKERIERLESKIK